MTFEKNGSILGVIYEILGFLFDRDDYKEKSFSMKLTMIACHHWIIIS